MNDTLDYFKKTSDERSMRPELLTFSMYYYYNERHLLPLSHDEVVHGKRTIIDKIFGEYEEKFPQLRTLYLYMYVHPGKKLNFMGNEIAMFREWDETKEPDNFLLKYPLHDSFHRFMINLNGIYSQYAALFARDYQPEGFAWLAMNDQGHDVFAIRRFASAPEDKNGETCSDAAGEMENDVAAVFNFSSRERILVLKAEKDEKWDLILHTDWECWSGNKKQEPESVKMIEGSSFVFSLPPFSGALYSICRQ